MPALDAIFAVLAKQLLLYVVILGVHLIFKGEWQGLIRLGKCGCFYLLKCYWRNIDYVTL